MSRANHNFNFSGLVRGRWYQFSSLPTAVWINEPKENLITTQ